jgi:hypothetical protein
VEERQQLLRLQLVLELIRLLVHCLSQSVEAVVVVKEAVARTVALVVVVDTEMQVLGVERVLKVIGVVPDTM